MSNFKYQKNLKKFKKNHGFNGGGIDGVKALFD
jgi:hypothetical protein